MIFESQVFVAMTTRDTNYRYSSLCLITLRYNILLKMYDATYEATAAFLIYLTS